MRIAGWMSMVLLMASAAGGQTPSAAQEPDLPGLTLEELMNVPVVTPSNTPEPISQAPATVIVITREEILERGYSDLTEIFDDLPGMDIIRPYGATYLKNYWRGYRNTIGDPFLLMVDGIVFNHLYFNTADVLVTFPIANVERVEVVYGPASSVYGPNAFMGVVNVITTRQRLRAGSYQRGTVAAGSFDSRLAEVHFFHQTEQSRFSVAGRFDNGNIDPGSGDRYEYTRNRYYQDRRLWGGFIDNRSIAGEFSSPRQNRAIDIRAYVTNFEAGIQYYLLEAGYGLEYAADRAQNKAVWARPDFSAYLRSNRAIGERVRSTSLLRYRTSKVTNDSFFVQHYEELDGGGRPTQTADFSYWQALNSSWSFFQDFEVKVSESLSLTTGFRYEQKDLQKAYDIHYGPAVPVGALDASTYPYPNPPVDSTLSQNHIVTSDEGIYLQTRYRFSPAQQMNFGLRYDSNSQYGDATTLRAGWISHRGPWIFKALYGEAFQEPSPRLLYGGWTGSGSDPDLEPERSRTIELSGSYTRKTLAAMVSAYRVQNEDTIINTATGAENLGERTVIGADLHAHAMIQAPWVRQLKLWGYASHLFEAEEDSSRMPSSRIGDLADDKLMLGVTTRWTDQWLSTLRARHVSARPTVGSNPVREVGSYTTMDLHARRDGLFARGIGLAIKVSNLFDEEYFHPGVRDASAGNEPGFFDAAGSWHGSQGYYSSLLPQPGRSIEVSIHFDFE